MNASGPPQTPSLAPERSERPALDRLIGGVLDREPFIALTGEDAPERTAALEAAIASLAERAVRFVRINNDLATPLTVGRVMLQLGADEHASDGQDEAERLLAGLTRRLDSEDQVVLAVEAAETLQPRALSFLQLLPGIRREGSPVLQVLFVGRPDFWTLLQHQAFGPIREQLVTRIVLGAPEPLAPAKRRPRVLAVLIAGAVPILGVGLLALGFFYRSPPYPFAPVQVPAEQVAVQHPPVQHPPAQPAAPAGSKDGGGTEAATRQADAPPLPEQPVADRTSTPPQAPAAPATAAPQTLTGESRAQLHRQFEAFLDRTGPAGLNGAQRQLLFEQYMTRHGGPTEAAPALTVPVTGFPGGGVPGSDLSAATPAPAAPLARRLVIRYPAGVASGEAEAIRLAATLRAVAARSETRAAADAPKQAAVQFFYREDEAAATAVAAELRGADADGAGAAWRVDDLTAYRPRPSRGTIDVLLPQQ